MTNANGPSKETQATMNNRNLYRALGESIDYGVWVCAADGRNIYASESFLNLVGLTQQQCSDFGWGDVLHPDDAERTITAWKECIRTEGVWDIEHRFRGTDGQWHPILARGVPVRDDNGEIFCWVGINLDISRLKEAEEALRESEKRHRLLSETMLQGAVHQDADGKIIAMNPAAERILGKSLDQFLGSSSVREEKDTIRENGAIFPGREHPSMVALQTGQTVHGVIMGVFNPALGEYRWIRIDAVPIFRQDDALPSGVYTVFEDITDLRQKEEKVRSNEERLRLALDAAHLGTWDWHIPSGAIAWNSEHFRMLGYEPDSFAPVYRHWADRVHPEDLPATEAIIQQAMEKGKDYQAEFRVILPDGTVRTLEALGRFELDASGQAVRLYGAMTDITGRKELLNELCLAKETLEQRVAERTEELQDLNAYNRTLIEASIDALVTIDADGKISDVNSATEKVTGCGRQELIGSDFSDYFTEPEKARHGYRLVFKEGLVRDYPLEICHRDGHKTPVLYNATVYHDKFGNIRGVFAAARDITLRKQAEKEREQFYKFFQTSTDIMAIANPDGAFLKVNPACTELLGYTEAELKAKPFIDFVHPDDKQETLAEMARQQKIGHSISFENRYLCKDGSIRWLSWRAVYNKDENCTYATGRDITVNKQQEEALRKSEFEFRMLAEAMPQIVWICSPDGKNIYFNQQWMDYTGMTREESFNDGWNKPFHPDDKKLAWDAWQNAVINGTRYSVECRLRRADGVYKWWLVRGVPVLDEHGAVLKWFGTCTDIDEVKKAEGEKLALEQQMQQVQKLESLGILAGGIAHDFNNILMAIIGNASLALMKLNPESPVVANLQQIEQASERAADLARQMLAYSGKGKFMIEYLDLNRLLEEMLQILEISISKKAALRLNLTPQLPAIEADATQMRQLIMNLVINASEAIGDNAGLITISSGYLMCDRNYLKDSLLDANIGSGVYVYLEIADSGCGMDKATLAKIFDPFFTTKFTGRGLGMAAVLGIIRGHKGAIKVCSEPGKGSIFRILLPASDRPVVTASCKTGKDNWQGGGTVLLVDDEELVLSVGAAMLKTLGFTVITAKNGREALEVFRSKNDFACVILDLTMPLMDGEQCFIELQQIKPDVKVLMSSGYSEQEVTQRFASKGLAGFIQKPYQLSALRKALKNILE